MSTRSTSSNLFSPLIDPESLILRRNLGEPSSLLDFEEVMSIPHNNQGPTLAGPPPPNNNGPPPVVRPNGPAPRSMEELCQPSINGRGGPIAPILIQATNFGLRHHMIQQVQNTCQFQGLPGPIVTASATSHLLIMQWIPLLVTFNTKMYMVKALLHKVYVNHQVFVILGTVLDIQRSASDFAKRKVAIYEDFDPFEAYSQLCATNVRARSLSDIEQIKQTTDSDAFQKYMKLCARNVIPRFSTDTTEGVHTNSISNT
ncbi:hypothetical protein Tco_0354955 [Tanacetum coccineum]